MVCRNFILPEICKPCLFLSTFQFAKLILPYQFMLADMEIQTQAARTLTLQVASRIDDGIVDASFGAVTKTFVSDTAVRVALAYAAPKVQLDRG